MEIRNIIIKIAKTPEKEIEDDYVEELLHKFLEVKYSLKFINIQRVKKSIKTKATEVEMLSTKENTYSEGPDSMVIDEEEEKNVCDDAG